MYVVGSVVGHTEGSSTLLGCTCAFRCTTLKLTWVAMTDEADVVYTT